MKDWKLVNIHRPLNNPFGSYMGGVSDLSQPAARLLFIFLKIFVF